jgi:alanyl-tRNA synthetase
VQGILKTEEEQFLRTLEAGMQRVAQLLDELDGRTLDGATAFDLWQTYGFPLDLTREMAGERGIRVDREGYEAAREKAREVSRGGRQAAELFAASRDTLGALAQRVEETTFLGYAALEADATVQAVLADEQEVDALAEGESGIALLDATPFYAEGGGQIGDSGKLEWDGGAAVVRSATRSSQGFILHHVRVVRGRLGSGQRVRARVDPARHETEKHHSATHLLHAALRSVLGTHVAQAGSLVAPDRLRFDFSHPQALTSEEIADVETLANRWIQADLQVDWRVVPIAEARKAGAMMLFGEKYGQDVRMVTMGAGRTPEGQANRPAVSIELCGGTHVRRTGEIGSLLVTSEEAVSAGVRRIEACVGMAALRVQQEQRSLAQRLARSLGGNPAELEERVQRLHSDLKQAQREAAQLRDRLAAAQTAGAAAAAELQEAGGFRYATAALDGLDATALRSAADALLGKSGADLVVVGSGSMLVAKVSAGAQQRGAHAGNLLREVARTVGGGGGGRPDMAQAGVKDPSSLPRALAAVPGVLGG